VRLTRLEVDAFRAIKHAEIDFGPGLNILYGPNDLGKSTLAAAVRAALLVPPSSSEAHSYQSWFGSDNPRVELTLMDPDGHYWQVKKTFGTSSSSSAELLHSKDCITFTRDCTARQVEEKLRAMLGWGIPAPGGSRGPRGTTTSFLANVLLAPQADADDILDQSITDDADESGKLRLTKALSTLAQDPLFKEVLDAAQREVDLCFTESGRRKGGRLSKFTEAANAVKAINQEIETRARQLQESATIEEEVNRLREERSLALMRLDEASASLVEVERRFEATAARMEAAQRVAAAKESLAGIDARIGELEQSTGALRVIEERVRKQESELAATAAKFEAEEVVLRAAEEALRRATSKDSAREQELRRAQLSERSSEVELKLVASRSRRAGIDAAIESRDEARRAQDAISKMKAALESAAKGRRQARNHLHDAATELELTRATVALIRWRTAVAAIEGAAKAKDAASSIIRDAETKEREGEALDAKVQTTVKALLKKSAALPTAEQRKALAQLERELGMAEAALGGGISVAVRSEAIVMVHAAIDQEAGVDLEISAERLLEAERTVRLAIADLVEVDITAGSTEKRKEFEALRLRWREEAMPLLKKSRLEDLNAVEALAASLTREQQAVEDRKREVVRLQAEAKSLRDQATIHEGRGEVAVMSREELEERKSAIGSHDHGSIEEHFRSIGSPTESKAEGLLAALVGEQKKREGEVAARERDVAMAEYQLSEAEKRSTELEASRTAKSSPFEAKDLDLLRTEALREIAGLEREQSENASQLQSLAAEANRGVQKAQAALGAAQKGHQAAKESRERAVAALDATRADANARRGALGVLRAQVESLDREAAAGLVKERQAELAALPPQPPATASDVQAAEGNVETAKRELERAKEALNLQEGALTRVGGAALREEVERLEEARVGAETRERDLEVDADAWKLLRDTLREVENDEGAHLGRALAGPVAARFEDLTAGRYHGLRLDAALKAESVEAATTGADGGEVLDMLSIGTRDQLATLIRLTIADELRSTIVLDDHLVNTDPVRLLWFREVLRRTSVNTQVIVLTCRAEDYLTRDDVPGDLAFRDLFAGTVRAINVERVLTRW
jgi:DNA repair exonuclease SbcCD ATPase subunit